MSERKYKEPTCAMKTALLDLLHIVMVYDDGKPGLPHEVRGVHHATLKAMTKKAYGSLILLDVTNSPTGLIWSVIMTRQGLKVAKRLAKEPPCNNDSELMSNKGKPKKTRSLRTIQWQVDVNRETGAKIYKDVKAMKEDRSQSFTRTMNLLMELHGELKAGQVALLQKLYPEAYAAMLLIAQNEIEMEREDRIEGLLEELKHHMLSQPAKLPSNFDFDDNEDTLLLSVQKDENAGKNANANFLRSVMALNPQPEPVQGIRTITAQTFDAPSFEDDDIEIEW